MTLLANERDVAKALLLFRRTIAALKQAQATGEDGVAVPRVLPVQLKPKHVALGVVLFDLFGFVFYEVMGAPSPFGFAHSAHLAGMLVGLVYYRFLHDSEWRIFSHKADITLPQWMKGTARAAAPTPAYRVDLSNRSDVRAEVDRILDKINSEGFGALTAEEKHLLDEARDLLSRR